MGNDPLNMDDLGLAELGERNDRLKQRVKNHTEVADAIGGAGPNQFDDDAREFSQKQVKVDSEIHKRLADQHEDRSEVAQRVDENRKAPRAPSPDVWADNPDQFDWPGVDTPR